MVTGTDYDKRTALHLGPAEAVAFLRSKGGELTNTDKYVYMLCNNAYAGKIDQLRSLVEGQNVSVNLADYDTRTALHVAAASGQASAVAYLLKAKADITIKDRWGQTAIDGAGTRQVVEMLGNPTFDWSSTITAQAPPRGAKGADANAKISPTTTAAA